MFFKNARIFCSDFRFHIGAFEVKDGVFGQILPQEVPEDQPQASSIVYQTWTGDSFHI